MHSGIDGAVLLQHSSAFLPTHLVVVNLDARLHDAIEEMAAFLPAFGVTILHVHAGEDATVPVREIEVREPCRHGLTVCGSSALRRTRRRSRCRC